jgi:PAS domain S-box-containing protein
LLYLSIATKSRQALNQKEKIIQQIRDLKDELIKLEMENKKSPGTEEALKGIDHNLVKALPDLLFVLDKNCNIIDVFESSEVELYKKPADSLPGANLQDILPKEIAELTRNKIQTVLNEGKKNLYQYSLNISGEKQYYKARMVPYGKEHVLAVISKISDKVNAEQIAQKKAGYLYHVMMNSPVGIMQLSKKGEILFVSESIRNIKKELKPQKDEGQECRICVNVLKEKFGSIEGVFEAVKKSTDKYLRFTVSLTDKDDQPVHLVFSLQTEQDPLDRKDQLFVFIENVTEYQQANQELKKNQERLKEIQELSRIAYWQYDPETDTFSGFNRLLDYLKLDGFKTELSKEELYAFLHPRDKEKMEYLHANMIARKYNLIEQFRLIINGRVYWMEIRSNVRQQENKKVPLIYGSIQDITAQKRQEELLKQSRKLQQTLVEQIPVAVYVKNAENHQIQIWNKAAEKLFGLPKDKVIGKTDSKIFCKKLSRLLYEHDKSILETKSSVQTEEESFNMPDGSKKILKVIQVPVVIDETVHYIMGIAMDLTESIHAKKQLIKAKNQAEKSDRLKSTHLANMSHEIRNPMNSIVGFSRILVEDENLDPKDKEEFISLINENAKHLLSLISDIIDIAKIENNKLKIFKVSFNINEQLKKLKSTYEQQLSEEQKTGVSIKTDAALPDDRAIIYTDENRFVQIFNNLISNAVKFTKEGEIRIGYDVASDGKLHFFVKDTGIGIEKSQQDQIFEEFHQLGANGKGKGLGLSISRQLVSYLGGSIWLESELGKGSAFYFSLPFDHPENKEPAPVEVDQNNTHSTTDTPTAEHSDYEWSDKKVLIVDDAKDVLTFVSILLRKTNVQVDTAINGTEAIQKVNESNGKYDLILMDIQMPGISGIDALETIKKSYPDIPVFAQTAFALEGDSDRFISKGFDDYIAKPVNKKELLKKMASFIEQV